jgi:hypothetical protein
MQEKHGMKLFFSFLLIFILSTASAQEINVKLKQKLDSVHFKDQALRELLLPETSTDKKRKVLGELGYSEHEFDQDSWRIILHQDSLNLAEVEKIIGSYGYPGKTLVGEPANKTAWLVIQHSEEIGKYFPIIKKAGMDHEIPLTLVATMEDRMLMYQGMEQVYGSQSSEMRQVDKATGKEAYVQIVWPIKNPEKVNELRKSIGFTTTIEEYSKILGIEYKVYKIEELK